jgi:hypothetical protein
LESAQKELSSARIGLDDSFGVFAYTQLAQPASKASNCSLSETGMISLPEIPDRIDHMAFSAETKLLVVAARNNNSIAVANVTSMRLDKLIGGFSLPLKPLNIPARNLFRETFPKSDSTIATYYVQSPISDALNASGDRSDVPMNSLQY